MTRAKPTARTLMLGAIAVVAACSSVVNLTQTQTKPSALSTVDHRAPYIKAHLRDGRVYVLSRWNIDTVRRSLFGTGELLDVHRAVVSNGPLSVPFDSVALYETNLISPHGSIVAMSVITGISAVITISCAANPKACFGSCPTYYVWDGERDVLSAEGFSSSIAPSLEATDVDALDVARPVSRAFTVRMTNEALETHVVRWVHVLAVPRGDNERVFVTTSGEFWRARSVVPPRSCVAAEGDCLKPVTALDRVERFSGADSTDLAAREEIELEFPPGASDSVGLVVGSRQTLMSTFVLYQMLAFLGSQAAPLLAAFERGDPASRTKVSGIERAFGKIEIQMQDSTGRWATVGETGETGPIARNLHVVPLPRFTAQGARRVRLRAARGQWRLDYVALAELSGRATPVRLRPVSVKHDGREDLNAAAALGDSAHVLTTMPGDEYAISYTLPEDFRHQELFIESRGYYLEWMREEWLAEENPIRAAMMFIDPAGALRALAPEFKRREASMEQLFWSSRYVRR